MEEQSKILLDGLHRLETDVFKVTYILMSIN